MSTYEMYQHEGEYEYEYESGLPAELEAELANGLLDIRHEQELEQFLGDIVSSVGSFLKGPVGSAIGGVLKNVAKTALPVVGGALGSFVAPGIGTAIGSKLGQFASSALGDSEVPGEREFETARKVVQLAHAAGQQATTLPPDMHPQQAAQEAVLRAVQQVAPGLQIGGPAGRQNETEWGYTDGDGYDNSMRSYTGRWVRRGRRIILFGV
jgi:uncharacterized protein (DUF697 family)